MSDTITTITVGEQPVDVFQGDIPQRVYYRFLKSKEIAVDLEYQTEAFDKFVIATTKLAAIQLFSEEGGSVVVRTHLGETPKNVLKLLKSKKIKKIFHYAFGDCSLIRHHWKTRIDNVICTKIAAKLLFANLEASTSLKDLLPRYLNIDVSKEQQLSDWFVKKLTPEQIAYAISDVLHLPALHIVLKQELEKKKKYKDLKRIVRMLPDYVENEVGGIHAQFGWRDPLIQYK